MSLRRLIGRLALVTSSFLVNAQAQSELGPSAVPRNIQFANVTTESGLSQEFAHAVVQDSQGYVWFGTQGGLNRFDGHDVVVYEHDPKDIRSLSSSFIWSLFTDADGNMWVGTDRGINRYDYASDSFERAPFPNLSTLENLRVRTIVRDREGTFWLGTLGSGLISVDPAAGASRRFVHDPEDAGSLPDDRILALHEDRKGHLWIGTESRGLARLDRVTESFVVYKNQPETEFSLSDDAVRSIYEDRSGNIWIGTSGGLNLFDVTSGTFKRYLHDSADPTSLSRGQVRSVIEDSKGTLWVGTDGGLNEWRPKIRGFVHYQYDPGNSSSLADNRVNAMFEDVSGVLWIATHGGISRWNYFSDIFSYYSVAEGFLQGDFVTSVVETSDGVLWAGTYGAGLSSLNMSTGEVTHYRHDPEDAAGLADDRVMTLHVDHADRLWVGSRSAGLSRFDRAGNRFVHYRHDPSVATSVSGAGITSIHSDPDGTLWIGVYGGGLNRLTSLATAEFDRFRHDPEDPGSLSSDHVLAIHRDKAGVLWLGTEGGGLNRFDEDDDRFSRFSLGGAQGTVMGDNVTAWDIVESRDGTLWIGTKEHGLIRWSKADRTGGRARFESFAKAEGLSSDVYGIVEGVADELWLSSNQGIARFEPDGGVVRHFDSRNGLRGNEFNQGARLRSRSGRLFFGGTDGLVGFYPSELPRNHRAPSISLVSESRDAQLVRSDGSEPAPSVELGYLDPFITFDFVALDFVSPDKNRYRYRLEGFDDAWIEGDDRFRRAVYTNLPAGDYTFRVQAANNDAVWNEEGSSVHVSVIPPFWDTWWAYLIYAACLAALFGWYLANQRRKVRDAMAQSALLERSVAERTHELAERNTELQFLNDKLAEASITDSLTGLHNRRFVDQFVEAEVSMVERRIIEGREDSAGESRRDSSKLMFFMMIDLDGFKQVNDTYGHHAGDRALVSVKERLVECCRQSDSVVRWGGDEFMVIGHAAGFVGTKVLAERIRENIVDQPYDVGQNNICRLSASIGIAPYPIVDNEIGIGTWEQVAAVADQAAYLAKTNGRDAWVSIKGMRALTPGDLVRISDALPELVDEGKLEIDSSIPGGIDLGVGSSVA